MSVDMKDYEKDLSELEVYTAGIARLYSNKSVSMTLHCDEGHTWITHHQWKTQYCPLCRIKEMNDKLAAELKEYYARKYEFDERSGPAKAFLEKLQVSLGYK